MQDIAQKLRQGLLSRNRGLWEALAATAGDLQARERVRAGITASALEQGHTGAADDPNVVADRIEAMASYDLPLLAELAAGWRQPGALSSDLMDSDNDFWAVAWARSLRHLERAGTVSASTVRSANFLVAREVRLIWGKPARESVSWAELVTRLHNGTLSYDEIRELSRVPIQEALLTGAQIRACAEALGRSKEPLSLLRILRGRTTLLDSSGRREVQQLFSGARDRTIGESIALIEVARQLNIPDVDELLTPLVDIVLAADSPRKVAPLAYSILRTGWLLP